MAEVTLNETADQVTLVLSFRSGGEGCLSGVWEDVRDLRPWRPA